MSSKISKIISLIPTFILVSSAAFANIYLVEGNLQIMKADVFLEHTLNIPKYTQSKFELSLNYTDPFVNGINSQQLENFSLRFTPEPVKIEKTLDRFGNHVNTVQFENVTSVQISESFRLVSSVNLSMFNSNIDFPLDKSQLWNVYDYLIQTHLTPSNLPEFINLANSITKGIKELDEAVIRIFEWVSKNIFFKPNAANFDTKSLLSSKEANRTVLLNGVVTLLKASGIPARIASGFSISEVLNISSINEPFVIESKFPDAEIFWVEVYFPDKDWVAFDPFFSSFFVPPNYVRRLIGTDTSEASGFIKLNNSNDSILKVTRRFAEIFRTNYQLGIYDTISFNNLLLFMPRRFGGYSEAFETVNYSQYSLLKLIPPSLDLNRYTLSVNSEISSTKMFAQQINLKDRKTINRIDLPLYRFNNDPYGKVWIEIAKDKDGKPGEVVYQSIPRDITTLNFQLDRYEWESFLFNSKSLPALSQGKWWIILNHETEEIIYWLGIFGNATSSIIDTIYTNKQARTWDRVANLDLCYKIFSK